MEKIEHINKIERLIRKSWRYNLKEGIDILKECQSNIQKELDIKEAKEKEKEQAILERILKCKEEKKKIEEERKRIHNSKPVRYKKPKPPLEERKQYTRCCKKCEGYYRTFSKYGQVCDGCKTSGVSDEVPKDLQMKGGNNKK